MVESLKERTPLTSKKCATKFLGHGFLRSFMLSIGALTVLFMPSAMAQAEDAVQNVANASLGPEIKSMACGIISCMSEMPRKVNAPVPTVKVPSRNYAAILQEMQNHSARFLLPGSPVPMNARVIFQLESEDAGLSQTVYFI